MQTSQTSTTTEKSTILSNRLSQTNEQRHSDGFGHGQKTLNWTVGHTHLGCADTGIYLNSVLSSGHLLFPVRCFVFQVKSNSLLSHCAAKFILCGKVGSVSNLPTHYIFAARHSVCRLVSLTHTHSVMLKANT